MCEYADLADFIDKGNIECKNEVEGFTVANMFDSNPVTYLQSDVEDSQLLMTITFRQPVRLAGIKFEAPAGAVEAKEFPDTVKIWNKKDDSLGFAEAEDNAATAEEKVIPGEEIPLKVTKFNGIHHVQIFVNGSRAFIEDQEEKAAKISKLTFIGQPAEAMDMKAWKPVKG